MKNFEMIDKLLVIAKEQSDKDILKTLTEDALENCISAFDGYGKEICRVNCNKSSNPVKAKSVSFQNIQNVVKTITELYGFDIDSLVTPEEWDFVTVSFQKRHLLAHKMGIVDKEYLRKSGDLSAVSGRIVEVLQDDVVKTRVIVEKIAQGLYDFLK